MLSMEMLMPTVSLFFTFGTFLVLYIGGPMALRGDEGVTAGNLYAFILYLNTFFFPLMQLSSFYGQLQAGFGAFERLLEVIDAVPEVDDSPQGIALTNPKGEITFRNLAFGYKKDEPILSGFNLTIKAGERLAIVGKTGAGKTTISSLICRFYEFQNGELLIDGVDIRKLNLKKYRELLGIVQQDSFLFTGTVRDNIRYGRRDATDEDIQRAINAVHADEFIKYMPEGLNTDVNERGARLSTGQRQLVCFARAIIADPRILILDEATSSVDAYTEMVIQEGLEALLRDRTSIVIAHRLSTVVNADRIIVMDHGKIVEEGSHAELIRLGGRYREIYDVYFRHQASDWKPEFSAQSVPVQVLSKEN